MPHLGRSERRSSAPVGSPRARTGPGRYAARRARRRGRRGPRRARAFADVVAPPRPLREPDELLAAENIDLVHLCTPPLTHAPLALESLQAGVTVLIEKPTALCLAEMDRLVAVSRDTGVPARPSSSTGSAPAPHGSPACSRRASSAARCWPPATRCGSARRVLRRALARPLGVRGRRAHHGPRHPPVRPAARGARPVAGCRAMAARQARRTTPRTCRWRW